MALMLEWFDRIGYSADMAGPEREFGRQLTKLPNWASTHMIAGRAAQLILPADMPLPAAQRRSAAQGAGCPGRSESQLLQ